MISADARRRIGRVLWPQGEATPGSLWAILDSARDRRIYQELQFSRLDHPCLYSGRLPTALQLTAPYMVELLPRYAFTRTLLEQGFGNSWGIFVRIDDWTRLRHHLRKLLTVRDESGRKLLFRWYDPRVLRNFLPTCRPEELHQVFGPVVSFFAESGDSAGPGLALHRYSFDGTRLQTHTAAIAARQEEDATAC